MRAFIQAIVVFAMIATCQTAQAQAPEQKEPVFSSGGIRAKVISVAPASDKQSVTLGVIVENVSQDDQLIALLGQAPRAIDNKGNNFAAYINTISGIALCNPDPGNSQVATAVCLDENSPRGLPVARYTLLEKGSSLTITLAFVRVGAQQPLGDQFTFSAQLAVRQTTNYGAVGGTKPTVGPAKLVSIGIPLIPFNG